MRFILILAHLVLALAFDEFSMPDADDAVLTGPNVVVNLSKENFTQFIQQNPVAVVEFYAPWCHHCKQLVPHYEKAARIMKEAKNPVAFGKVDATIEEALAVEHSVEGYPTIKIFHQNSAKPFEYEGPREPGSAIAEYLEDFAEPTWTPPPSDVVILTKDNFTEFTFTGDLTLVEFYAPWCGHCKRLEPKYEKAATMLKKDTNIRLAKIDGTVETELAAIHNITGYPTLFVYRKGGKRMNYDGEQTENGIVSTMKEYLSLPSHEVKNVNEYRYLFRKNDRPVIVGVFKNEQDRFYQLFMDFAYKNRRVYQFGHTFDKIPGLESVEAPAIVLQHHPEVRSSFEEEKYVFDQAIGLEKDLERFVEGHKLPLVGILTQENQRNIYLSRRPICIVVYDVDFSFEHRDRTQYWRNKILQVAKNYKKKITFAIADEEKMESLLKEFGLEESGEDVNVGCFDKDGLKFRMDEDDEFNSDSFAEFIDRFSKGKLTPYFKSQPTPKQAVANGIHTVVGRTFDKIVKDRKKNVVIFFYAPWCGHCTKFKPTYAKLAQHYAKKSDMVIAQMDATANDIPKDFEVTGFPTIYFVPTNNQAVKYNGDRQLDDLIDFIDNHVQSKTEL